MFRNSIKIFFVLLVVAQGGVSLNFSCIDNQNSYELEFIANKTSKHRERRRLSLEPLTEDDKSIIEKFIVDLDEKSIEQLIEINKTSKVNFSKFKNTHPIILAKFIMSERDLNQHVKKILQTEKKSELFLFVLSIKIKEAKEEGSLNEYIIQFSDLFNLDINIVKNYIDKELYKDLVKYMFY